MSEQRPCRYQVGDRVIYGGESGCLPKYEGRAATVVSIEGSSLFRKEYIIVIDFDRTARYPAHRFTTFESRVQSVAVALDFDVTELL